MRVKCKAQFIGGRPCNRWAVDRGWCNLHSIPPSILLCDDLQDAAEHIKCPCKWGDVTSPAWAGDDTVAALSCIDCGTQTEYMPMTEPHHIQPLVDAWKSACEQKRRELERACDDKA